MSCRPSKEVMQIIRPLLGCGWTLDCTPAKHPKIVSPSGKKMALPSTPGEWRSVMNTRRDIKRIAQPGELPEGF